MISGVLLILASACPPNKLRTAAVSIVVLGHNALQAILSCLNSSAQPKVIILILYFEMV